MTRFIAIIGALLWFFAAVPCAAQENKKNISILYTGDTHGHLQSFYHESSKPVGGIAKRAIYFAEKRRHKSMIWLTLDSGDALSGTALSDVFQGYLDIQAMNKLKYDAMALGVHDFDYGVGILRQRMGEAEFPILSANLFDTSSGQTLAQPYVVLEREGIRIAILGLTTGNLANLVASENLAGISVNDPVQTAKLLMPQISAEADIIIALTHLGINDDIRLASQVPEIDIIVGGMSHSLLEVPLRVGQTLIVHDSYYGKNVGLLKTTFAKQPGGRFQRAYHSNLIEPMAGKWVENSNYLEWLESFKENLASRMGTLVGRSSMRMSSNRSQSSETELGNFACDVLRSQTGADIALLPAQFFRSVLPQGDITLGDLYRTMPYDHYCVVLSVTGGELQEILNDAAGQIGLAGFPQVSGVSFGIFNGRAHSVMVGDSVLDPFATYSLATTHHLAEAALGYAHMGTIKNTHQTGRFARDLIKEHLMAGDIASARLERRVEFLAQEPVIASAPPPSQTPGGVPAAPGQQPTFTSSPPTGSQASTGSLDERYDRNGQPVNPPGTEVMITDEEITDPGSDLEPNTTPTPTTPDVTTPPYTPPLPSQPGPPPLTEETVVEGGLEYTYSIYTDTEGYLFKLVVHNPTQGPIGLTYPTGERFDFEVYDGSNLVWNFHHNWFFVQNTQTDSLSPGDERSFEGVWNGMALDDTPLGGRTLRFEATHKLVANPARVSFSAALP